MLHAARQSRSRTAAPRRTVIETAWDYIEPSKQKPRKTYLGYRTALNLFQICREDMLDFPHELRTRRSTETGNPIGESTVSNYFLETMVFLNGRGIGKFVTREDWLQKKDRPVHVDKRNKDKKYASCCPN
ncbi:MAG: hypothetical protein ABSA57_06225 [Candidatus Acidiferrales bacterium]